MNTNDLPTVQFLTGVLPPRPGAKVFISLHPDGRFQVSRLTQNDATGLFISPT